MVKRSVRKQAVAASTPATITVEEAARRLRIGRNQAYEAVHKNEIPSIKIGRRFLIPTAALSRLLGETT